MGDGLLLPGTNRNELGISEPLKNAHKRQLRALLIHFDAARSQKLAACSSGPWAAPYSLILGVRSHPAACSWPLDSIFPLDVGRLSADRALTHPTSLFRAPSFGRTRAPLSSARILPRQRRGSIFLFSYPNFAPRIFPKLIRVASCDFCGSKMMILGGAFVFFS
jgi:hypothetical protein